MALPLKKHLAVNKSSKRYLCMPNKGKDGLQEADFMKENIKDRCKNCNYKQAVRDKRRSGDLDFVKRGHNTMLGRI